MEDAAWELRLAAGGEQYQAEKQRLILDEATRARLEELMAEHACTLPSAMAGRKEGRDGVRGAAAVLSARRATASL